MHRTLWIAIFALGCVAQEEPVDIDEVSQAFLAREQITELAEVKHILISWADMAEAYGERGMDPRAAARSRQDADELVTQLLAQVRRGDPIDSLMKEHSEDSGSAAAGTGYTATPESSLVPPFKALSLRLNVGESAPVLTRFGWHIILRLE